MGIETLCCVKCENFDSDRTFTLRVKVLRVEEFQFQFHSKNLPSSWRNFHSGSHTVFREYILSIADIYAINKRKSIVCLKIS